MPQRDVKQFYDGMFINTFYFERDAALAPAFKRIGIDWFRTEFGWSSFEPQKGKFDWKKADQIHDLCRQNKFYVMNLAAHAPKWAQPTGNFIDIPYKNGFIKLDNSPGRDHFGDWANAWKEYLARYKDTDRAINLWNEPWEGGGISGWKSTGEHYRQLLAYLKQARDQVDPSIQLVAADAGGNTAWKIFAANQQANVDVISSHYESPKTAPAYAMARFYKKLEWETETWMSWQGDAASLRRCLYNLSLGGGEGQPLDARDALRFRR